MDPLDVASAENRTGQLKKAAGYALCRRYHQNQANDIVREWKRILREEVPRRPERRRGESPEERAASRNHRRSASHADSVMAPLSTFPSPPSTSSSTRSRSGSQEPRQQNDRHNRPSRQLDRGDDQLAELRRTVEEVVRQNEEFMREREEMTRGIEEMVRLIEDLLAAQRRSPSVRTRERQRQSVVAREVVEVPEWEPEPESEPESETEPEPEPEPANQQTCTATHQLRRSVDEDCVICTMPMVNSPLSELVWCKNSCGQSVHKQCFETMGQHTQVVRCVFWLASLLLLPLPIYVVTVVCKEGEY